MLSEFSSLHYTPLTPLMQMTAPQVYVLVRALHGTPSRRHLFLGQCLLLGLLMCSLSGLPIALTPTPLSCGATR